MAHRLRELARQGQSVALRAFVTGCAARTEPSASDERLAWMLLVARAMDRNTAVAAEVREALRGEASGALVVGLRRGLPGAVRFLAVYTALHPDAYEAAREAALLEVRHAHLTDVPGPALVARRQEAWLDYVWRS